MRLALLHRRLTIGMALTALAAFISGAGPGPLSVGLGGAGLTTALFWRPSGFMRRWIEVVWQSVAVLLLGWLGWSLMGGGGDLLGPALALLLVLLVGESLRPLGAANDVRLYALAFALLMAGTAFRPGIQFAVAFAAFIAAATLTLMVGHLRRQAARHGVAHIPIGRTFLVAIALLSSVTVLMSAVVFLALPRLPGGMLAPTRTADGAVMAGFSDEVSLGQHGSHIRGNPRVMLRIEFPGNAPPPSRERYWRGRSYDHFDGVRWSRSTDLPDAGADPRGYQRRWQGTVREQTVYGGPPGARVLFGLHPIIALEPRSAMQVGGDRSGDIHFRGPDPPAYTVWSGPRRPPEVLLQERPGTERERLAALRYYLQRPELSPRIAALADSLVEGQTSRLNRTRAVERWFHREFDYTRELPASPSEATLEHFLFERRAAHCEYFSTAMVILLRELGIPARNVTGFLGGEWNEFGGYLAVTGNAAHSWVEVWFPRAGWVSFDPTPAAVAEQIAGGAAGPSRVWPAMLLLDGLQHRWSRWVLDFDRDRQVALLRGVREMAGAGDGRDGIRWARRLVAAAIVVLVGVALFLTVRRRPRNALSAEARLFRSMRRRYVRAGYLAQANTPPLAGLAALKTAGAPALQAADRLTRLYVRARFGGDSIGEEGRAEMRAALAEVRRGTPRRTSARLR